MDTSPIKAALGDLEQELQSARTALLQIENEYTGARVKAGTARWESPGDALPWLLNRIFETMLVVLEAAGLTQTRQHLIDRWDSFEKNGGIGNTRFQAGEYLESEPLNYLETLHKSLRMLSGEGLRSDDSFELTLLERLLRNTATLLHKRDIFPKKRS